MRFRPLQPPLGWPAFLNEILIVVLGVLIALGAGELVQDHNQRRNVEHAERALKSEIFDHVQHMVERIAGQNCQAQRLSELRAKLQQSDGRWTADPLRWKLVDPPGAFPSVYRASLRPWTRQAWATALASDVVRHMDRRQATFYSQFYTQVERIARINDSEPLIASRLGPLAFDQQLDRQTILQMQATLAELDYLNSRMANGSRQMLSNIRDARLGYSPSHLDAKTATLIKRLRQSRGDCVRNVRVRL